MPSKVVMKLSRFLLFALIPAWLCAVNAVAQSSDQNLPTPVLANQVSGSIAALDLGDSRQTRHYYAFEGTPGDLLITIESKNLNGDVDVFTAITFRPLLKTTIYANVGSPQVTKGFYLRSRQILILRVEGRTPNDEPGTYQIRFGGTFAKFSGGIPVAEPTESAEIDSEKSTANRLSSVGATLPRPVTENLEPAEAKPTPENTEEAKPTTPEKPRTTSRRTGSRNPRRTSRTSPAKPSIRKPESEKPAETNSSGEEKAQPQGTPPSGAHLIIERKDGTRIDRPMSTVRRVVIEGPAIVILLKSGRVERIPMSIVARMAIEPQ